MIYFTSDLHFFHGRLIQHVSRPFHNEEQMNKALIRNWNNKIKAEDEVYILGDFTMKGPELASFILSQLKGKKYLIRGNHDQFAESADFDISQFLWIKDYGEVVYQNTRFILFHYPIMEWNGYYKGTVNLHGHQHNHEDYNYRNLEQGILRYDVGVDANYMAPVSAEDIIAFFQMGDLL